MRGSGPVLAPLRTAAGLAWSARPAALAGVVLLGAVQGVVPVALAWLTKLTLDAVVAGATTGTAWALGVGIAVAGLASAGVPPLRALLTAELGRAVSVRAKDRLFRRVADIPLLGPLEVPAFRDRLRLAEQAGRGAPGDLVGAAVGTVEGALTLTGLVVAVALIEPWVAVVLVVSAAPALAAEIQLSRARAAVLWRISPVERRELFYADLLIDLRAAQETRLFGTGPLFRRRMLTELVAGQREQSRFERGEARTQVLLAGLSAALAGGAVVALLVAAAAGRAGAGDVAAVIVAVGALQGALASVVQQVGAGHHAAVLMEHYRAVVDTPDERIAPARVLAAVAGGARAGLELDDVWFRYGEDQPWVLRGVSLTIRPGEAVALVGENGSGKTTLVKLLCRFYDPTRGAVRWDGVDLRDLPPEDVRRRIGAVFQDFVSYELTAEENIAIGGVDGREEIDADPARIEEAARRAGIHDALAALPRGYRTPLTRMFVLDTEEDDPGGGVLLSGGQWQRLALARALARGQRDLLVLDEPSSGLDAEAEHRLHHRVREHRRGRTSVLISHRLNTVRDADRILVLAAGGLVEAGDHDSLMARGGVYARMFRLQSEGFAEVPA